MARDPSERSENYDALDRSGGKTVNIGKVGKEAKMPKRSGWTPLNGGVSIGANEDVKTNGVKIRGTGAATKGLMARGPMA